MDLLLCTQVQYRQWAACDCDVVTEPSPSDSVGTQLTVHENLAIVTECNSRFVQLTNFWNLLVQSVELKAVTGIATSPLNAVWLQDSALLVIHLHGNLTLSLINLVVGYSQTIWTLHLVHFSEKITLVKWRCSSICQFSVSTFYVYQQLYILPAINSSSMLNRLV